MKDEDAALVELEAERLWNDARQRLGLRFEPLPSSRSDFRKMARNALAIKDNSNGQ
jgi:hypothetical protein